MGLGCLPRTVFFDFSETLLTNVRWDVARGNERLLSLCEGRGTLDIEELAKASDLLRSQIDCLAAQTNLEISAQPFQKLLLDLVGLVPIVSPQRLELEWWISATQWQVPDGIVDLLAALRARNIRLAVLSNNMFSSPVLRYELRRHGLEDFFDMVMSSAEYPVKKPHPLIFDVALRRMGTAANAAWCIGDSLDRDIAGAISAGLFAVWYNPKRRSRPVDNLGFIEVRDWREFLSFLGQHER